MNLVILAAAAALLPAGRGDPVTAPLDLSGPLGAVAVATYRDRHGEPAEATCVLPCRLLIAQRAPFVLSVTLDGRELRIPSLKWRPTMLGAKLEPAAVAVSLP